MKIKRCLVFFEEKLIYCPTRYPDGEWEPDVPDGVILEDVFFESNGVKLHGWFISPQNPVYKGAVLMCHGNAGNLTGRYKKALSLSSCGVPVFLFDYRGYGRSDKKSVTEQGVYDDSFAAWTWLEGKGFSSIVIHGTSLGGGVATFLATHKDPVGVSLESTFTSIPDMSKEVYPFIPRFIISTDFNNLERIAEIKVPLQILHGTEDKLIPHWMGEKLFEAACCEKEFFSIEGADHNDLLEVAGEAFSEHFQKLLDKVLVKI
jgi:uncharacterized protein